MSYELSFDKKNATLLAVCAIVMAVLLTAAGYLVGIRRGGQQPSSPASALASTRNEGAAGMQTKASDPADFAASTPSPSDGKAKSNVELPSGTSQISPAVAKSEQANFAIQFGAFEEKTNADALVKELKGEGVNTVIYIAQDQGRRTWYTVRSGAYPTMIEASAAVITVGAATHRSVLVRPAHKLYSLACYISPSNLMPVIAWLFQAGGRQAPG